MEKRQSSSQEEAAIRNVVESWAAAVRRRDFDGILQNHSSDIVMFDVPPRFHPRASKPTRRPGTCFSPAPVIRLSLTLLR